MGQETGDMKYEQEQRIKGKGEEDESFKAGGAGSIKLLPAIFSQFICI